MNKKIQNYTGVNKDKYINFSVLIKKGIKKRYKMKAN